jgi:hypothetical protein
MRIPQSAVVCVWWLFIGHDMFCYHIYVVVIRMVDRLSMYYGESTHVGPRNV